MNGPEFEPIKPILSRKLNDLDVYHPGFGFAVGTAIMNTNWIFVDGPLGVTCDSKDEILDLEKQGLKPIQIANRLERQVRISREAWNGMSDLHRAALLLHEAVYSLAPAAQKTSQCAVPMRKTQQLIGWVFNQSAFSNGLPNDVQSFFPFGEINPFGYLEYASDSKGNYYTGLGVSVRLTETEDSRLNFWHNEHRMEYSDKALRDTSRNLCEQMINSGQDLSDIYSAAILSARPPIRLDAVSDGFIVRRQPAGYRVPIYGPRDAKFFLNFGSVESCGNELIREIYKVQDKINQCGPACL